MPLHFTDMADVATVFQETFAHVTKNLEGSTAYEEVIKFCGHLVLFEKPYILVSSEGLPNAITMTFTRESVRDFVMTLSYNFFTRWGGSQEAIAALADNLSFGAGQAQVGRDLCAMPQPIAARLGEQEDTKTLLLNNRWLMVLLLIQAFISMPNTADTQGG